MICHSCGKNVSDTAKFCENCGSRIMRGTRAPSALPAGLASARFNRASFTEPSAEDKPTPETPVKAAAPSTTDRAASARQAPIPPAKTAAPSKTDRVASAQQVPEAHKTNADAQNGAKDAPKFAASRLPAQSARPPQPAARPMPAQKTQTHNARQHKRQPSNVVLIVLLVLLCLLVLFLMWNGCARLLWRLLH